MWKQTVKKANQKRKTMTIYSELAIARESVTVSPRKAEVWESLLVTKGLSLKRRLQVCPEWRLQAWGSCWQAIKKWSILRVLPGDSVVKNLPANAGEMGLISDRGRSDILQGK